MKIGILNSGGYNFNSIKFSLSRLSFEDVCLVENEDLFYSCDRIIIPGVGAAKNAMQMLKKQNLITCIQNSKKPILGICLGMQIMTKFSEEGFVDCLGIFNEKIVKLKGEIPIPQMGWNKLIKGKYENEFVYFANSYYLPNSKYTKSFVNYFDIEISAIIKKDNFIGCQFHPEKSGKIGEKILQDFLYDNI